MVELSDIIVALKGIKTLSSPEKYAVPFLPLLIKMGKMPIKFIIYRTRLHELGDKFSTLKIVQQDSLILNPQGFQGKT